MWPNSNRRQSVTLAAGVFCWLWAAHGVGYFSFQTCFRPFDTRMQAQSRPLLVAASSQSTTLLFRRRIVEAFALDIVGGDERDGARTGSRNVREREAVHRACRRNIFSVNQIRHVLHADVFETDVLHARPFFQIGRA